MAWDPIYTDRSVASIDPSIVAGWRARLTKLGYNDPQRLHPFAFEDLTQDLAKYRLLLAYNMGLGKTATALAGADTLGIKHTLIVVPNKLIGEWMAEVERLGLADETQVIESLADITGFACPKCGREVNTYRKVIDTEGRCHDVKRTCPDCGAEARGVDRLKRFNLISLRTLWTIPKDHPHAAWGGIRPAGTDGKGQSHTRERHALKHSFAHILRRRAELVIVDEAYAIGNPTAKQTRAVNLLKPRRRWLMTGTPVRGYPDNILALLNWCLGTGTDLFGEYDSTKQSSRKRFISDFGTFIQKRREDGSVYAKMVPKIKNPERFQQMLAPVMRRRVNLEPDVARAIRMPEFVIEPEQIKMDPLLHDIYNACVTNFVTWFREQLAKAKAENRKIPEMTLLTKLNFLGRLASVPQAIVPDYTGFSTKQERILEIIDGARQRGRSVILLTEFPDAAKWYAALPQLADMHPQVVTGGTSLTRSKRTGRSKRDAVLDTFRGGDSSLLVATTKCIAEGYNLPQGSVVIFDSFPWVPSVQNQAWSRVLRPQQTESPVEIYLVGADGTVDDYLGALCAVKRAAIGEGIDYETIKIDAEAMPDPKDYAYKLAETTIAIAATYDATSWVERLKAQATAAQLAA